MDITSIQQSFLQALIKLLKFDQFLLENDLNERTISHILACYLLAEFRGWDVDCEYNRNHDDIKRLNLCREPIENTDTEAKTVFPDIIVHMRNTDYNLLIVEIKKEAIEYKRNKDLYKITRFMEELKYSYGLFINLVTGGNPGIKELVWFKNGIQIPKEINLD